MNHISVTESVISKKILSLFQAYRQATIFPSIFRLQGLILNWLLRTKKLPKFNEKEKTRLALIDIFNNNFAKRLSLQFINLMGFIIPSLSILLIL